MGKEGGADSPSLTSGLAGAAHVSLFPLLLSIFPFSTLSPLQGQLPASQNNLGHRRNAPLPVQSSFSEVLDVTQSCPPRPRALGPACLFQPRLIQGVGKGQVSLRGHKPEAAAPAERQHSPLLVGVRGAAQALLGDDHPLVQGSWQGDKHSESEQQEQHSSWSSPGLLPGVEAEVALPSQGTPTEMRLNSPELGQS